MKSIISILLIAGVLSSCQTTSGIIQTVDIKKDSIQGCDSVPSTERLTCIGIQRQRDTALINDPGKLLDQKILEKDSYCMRIEQTWERGSSLPETYRIKEINTFTVCRYSTVWDKVKDGVTGFGIGFVTGFVTAVGVVK